MSAAKRHQAGNNGDYGCTGDGGASQSKKNRIEPPKLNSTSTLATDLTEIQVYISEFENLQKDNQTLKELASSRLSEFERLHQSNKEISLQLEQFKLNHQRLSDKIVATSAELKCLESKYLVVENEKLLLQHLLEENKKGLDTQTSELNAKTSDHSMVPVPQVLKDGILDTEKMKDLKLTLKRAINEQNEMKLLLDVYKDATKDSRDKTHLIESEKKIRKQFYNLTEQMKKAKAVNKMSETDKQTNESLLAKVKTLEKTVFQMKKNLEAKQVEEEAMIKEMERTGKAYDEILEQNKSLREQIKQKDDAYFKLAEENLKQKNVLENKLENADNFNVTVKVGVNVALAENGAKFVNYVLDNQALNENLSTFSTHKICTPFNKNKHDGIVVELSEFFLLNRIKLLLRDKDDRSYSYYLEVSLNGINWLRICDYSMYFSRSWQIVAFPANVVKFIKIVGTHSTFNLNFHIVAIQAFFARDTLQLDHTWNAFGLLVPKVNVATVSFGAKVIRGKGGNNMINGDFSRRHENSTYQDFNGLPIVLQLSQPYVLGSMRFLLWDKKGRTFSYNINVSTNLVDWETIAHSENETSWQNLKFKPVPVVFIWIASSCKTSITAGIQVIHFECPLQSVDFLI